MSAGILPRSVYSHDGLLVGCTWKARHMMRFHQEYSADHSKLISDGQVSEQMLALPSQPGAGVAEKLLLPLRLNRSAGFCCIAEVLLCLRIDRPI